MASRGTTGRGVRPLRTLFILFVLVVAVFGTLLAGTKWGGATWAPKLALDLEGGTQVILTPSVDNGGKITDSEVNQAIKIIRQRVDASGVAEAQISSQGGQNIVVALPGHPSEDTLNLVRKSAQMRFRTVLLPEFGVPGVGSSALANQLATPTEQPAAVPGDGATSPADGATPSEGATQGLGLGGAGAARLAVAPRAVTPSETPSSEAPTSEAPSSEAPSDPATDPAPTAVPTDLSQLTDEELRQAADFDGDGKLSDTPATAPTGPTDTNAITEQDYYDFLKLDCTKPENLLSSGEDDPDKLLVTCQEDGRAKFILGPMIIPGTDIAKANSGPRTNERGVAIGGYAVNLEFNADGKKKFSEITTTLAANAAANPNGYTNLFAIVLDGLVVSAPSVDQAIPNGQAQIYGSFTRESAATMAQQLSYGALPITFTVQSEEQISATLGSEQLEKGLLAGLIGLALVVLYSIFQYRGLAMVTVASLVVAGTLTFGVIALLSWLQGYRLSLPGVAGLIVAIGITADSFIVYFERIRDEVREGRALGAAVEMGWQRARRTILASDAVNLLAAGVLYFLAVGGVRGFAFTLGLTTLIDLVVVFLFTHPMVQLLVRTKFFGEGHRMSGLDPVHLGANVTAYAGRGRVRSPQERAGAGSLAERKRAAAQSAAAEIEDAPVSDDLSDAAPSTKGDE